MLVGNAPAAGGKRRFFRCTAPCPAVGPGRWCFAPITPRPGQSAAGGSRAGRGGRWGASASRGRACGEPRGSMACKASGGASSLDRLKKASAGEGWPVTLLPRNQVGLPTCDHNPMGVMEGY
jgi:hypothetical protein